MCVQMETRPTKSLANVCDCSCVLVCIPYFHDIPMYFFAPSANFVSESESRPSMASLANCLYLSIQAAQQTRRNVIKFQYICTSTSVCRRKWKQDRKTIRIFIDMRACMYVCACVCLNCEHVYQFIHSAALVVLLRFLWSIYFPNVDVSI